MVFLGETKGLKGAEVIVHKEVRDLDAPWHPNNIVVAPTKNLCGSKAYKRHFHWKNVTCGKCLKKRDKKVGE